jgi:predicted amidohydrolase YtcJ
MYGDGALGSRGACLLKPYSDDAQQHGFLVTGAAEMEDFVSKLADSEFQLATHCIGDSAVRLVLSLYARFLAPDNDRRWRIEHAQVVDPHDMAFFRRYRIIPSVQPTHATSDMEWAGRRLGKRRVRTAYAYRELLQQNGWMPLGTDFPVEQVNPMLTFCAAVDRTDPQGKPPGGFQRENAIGRGDALKGITLWGAKASFEAKEKGSIEKGKVADFVVMGHDLMNEPIEELRNAKVLFTFVDGKRVN